MAYIGKQPTVGNFVKLDAITTSATATYNLLNGGVAYSPQSANHCIVSLNGVIQSPTTSFTISGSTIVFASALTASDVIDFILVLGDVLNIGTPSDNTVTTAKLASSLDFSSKTITLASNMKNTPAFQAFLSSSVTPTSGVATKMTYQTEIYDTDNCYDNSVNYRFTPNVAGKYYVYAKSFLGGSGGNANGLHTYIYKNGAVNVYTRHIDVATSNINSFTGTTSSIIDMNGTTDFLEIFTEATGTGLNFYGDSGGWSNFGAFRIIGA